MEPLISPSQNEICPEAKLRNDLLGYQRMLISTGTLHLKGSRRGAGDRIIGDRTGGPSCLTRNVEQTGRRICGCGGSHPDHVIISLDSPGEGSGCCS